MSLPPFLLGAKAAGDLSAAIRTKLIQIESTMKKQDSKVSNALTTLHDVQELVGALEAKATNVEQQNEELTELYTDVSDRLGTLEAEFENFRSQAADDRAPAQTKEGEEDPGVSEDKKRDNPLQVSQIFECAM